MEVFVAREGGWAAAYLAIAVLIATLTLAGFLLGSLILILMTVPFLLAGVWLAVTVNERALLYLRDQQLIVRRRNGAQAAYDLTNLRVVITSQGRSTTWSLEHFGDPPLSVRPKDRRHLQELLVALQRRGASFPEMKPAYTATDDERED